MDKDDSDQAPDDRESRLADLHDALLDHLLARVKSGEATAAELNQCINLLKLDGISCDLLGTKEGRTKIQGNFQLPFLREVGE